MKNAGEYLNIYNHKKLDNSFKKSLFCFGIMDFITTFDKMFLNLYIGERLIGSTPVIFPEPLKGFQNKEENFNIRKRTVDILIMEIEHKMARELAYGNYHFELNTISTVPKRFRDKETEKSLRRKRYHRDMTDPAKREEVRKRDRERKKISNALKSKNKKNDT